MDCGCFCQAALKAQTWYSSWEVLVARRLPIQLRSYRPGEAVALFEDTFLERASVAGPAVWSSHGSHSVTTNYSAYYLSALNSVESYTGQPS